jgi:hypothetical protein
VAICSDSKQVRSTRIRSTIYMRISTSHSMVSEPLFGVTGSQEHPRVIEKTMASKVVYAIRHLSSLRIDKEYIQDVLPVNKSYLTARVLSLPDDVIVTIFELCVPDTRFSQVCAAWRTLAVSNPCLWTTINFGGSWALHVLECLRRAQDCLLDIEFGQQYMWRNMLPLGPCLDAYLAKASRVRTLKINCYNLPFAEHILRSHISAPPALEELQVRVHYLENSEASFDNSAAEAEEDEPRTLALGPDLLGGAAPRLRTLLLEAVTIDPSWLPCSQLRVLCISDGQMSADSALRLLAATPLLEHLSIYRITDEDDVEVTTTQKPELSHLRKFDIYDSILCIATIIQHLIVPSSTILSVVCRCMPPEEAEVHDLLHTLSPHLDANRERFLASAVELEGNYGGWHLRATDDTDEAPWIEFCFELDVGLLATTFGAYMPLSGVKTLQVPSDFHAFALDQKAWGAVLASMPQVESVLTHEVHAPFLCEALITSSLEAPPCPRLRQLTLTLLYGMHKTLEYSRTLLDLVADAMRVRRDLGVPITTLQLKKTRMDDVHAICAELSERGIEVEVLEDDCGVEGSDARGMRNTEPRRWLLTMR